jgi:hypothetical protein
LRQIPRHYRLPLLLVLAGYAHQDIAVALGVNVNTVKLACTGRACAFDRSLPQRRRVHSNTHCHRTSHYWNGIHTRGKRS